VPQDVLHPALLQRYGEQAWVPLSAQLPSPSQVSAFVKTALLHEEAAQTVPDAYSLHALAPLQKPFRSQEAAPSSGHSPSGSVPSEMAVQTPTLPVRLHFSQMPAHRLLQHTPSAQNPLAHSPPPVQACPSDFLHVPEAHEYPGAQSPSVEHEALQAPPEQM
jgi:hypothetical protein